MIAEHFNTVFCKFIYLRSVELRPSSFPACISFFVKLLLL